MSGSWSQSLYKSVSLVLELGKCHITPWNIERFAIVFTGTTAWLTVATGEAMPRGEGYYDQRVALPFLGDLRQFYWYEDYLIGSIGIEHH